MIERCVLPGCKQPARLWGYRFADMRAITQCAGGHMHFEDERETKAEEAQMRREDRRAAQSARLAIARVDR